MKAIEIETLLRKFVLEREQVSEYSSKLTSATYHRDARSRLFRDLLGAGVSDWPLRAGLEKTKD